jgi:hypothetical protein
MPPQNYPKKSFLSYLVPFVFIIALLGSGWYILQNNVNLDDLKRFLQPPEVAKDEKVMIVYQEGENQVKPWSQQEWQVLSIDTVLQVGDTLKTSAAGVIVLRFFEESEVRIAEKSEVKLIRLDENEVAGDHIALELISGKLWRRGKKSNSDEADFILNTNQLAIQMNEATVVDISSDPETLRVIGGKVMANVAEKSGGVRKPIARVEVNGGEQLILDTLIMDQLKVGEKNVVTPIEPSYQISEWYLWNIEKEEKLGYVVEPQKVVIKAPEVLEPLDVTLLSVLTPKDGQVVSSKVLVSGTYDKEKISAIWVNDQEATLGLTDQWELAVVLSEQVNVITISALETGVTIKKQLKPITLKVDTSGPLLGKVTKPEIDDNGNGTIIGDKITIEGEVDTDAKKICVTFNDKDPYCLKQFVPGSKTYKYLGGVGYGNLVSGKNKYLIVAYDQFENKTEKVIYVFKDVPKPESKVEDSASSTTAPTTTPVSTTELPKPVISSPDPSVTLETTEITVTITGTVDPKTASLLINGKKASYETGSNTFSVTLDLTLGENVIKVQSSDAQGNKSKSALLTVLRLEKAVEKVTP